MKIYRVVGAHSTKDHGHVASLAVRKWRVKKKNYGKKRDLSIDTIIGKMHDGAVFRAKARDGKSSVSVIFGRCGKGKCSEITLRTIADNSEIDTLDYMKRG